MFKKNDKEDMEYYRPVALIPVFSKIFERVIYNSLYEYLQINNLLVDEQKGFRKGCTIDMAIFEFLTKVITCMDQGRPVSALFMDMKKAFDYVDHEILLNKLEGYGVRGSVLSLIRSYLNKRSQVTQIKRICPKCTTEKVYTSGTRHTEFGVPQGSVLGPLLFLVYINDLPKVVNHPIVLFADDSTALFMEKNKNSQETQINDSLEKIIDWMTSNNLIINLTKTYIMNFRQRAYPDKFNIYYRDTIVDETQVTKFLGIYVDNKVNWKAQIDNICKKINKFSYALHVLSKVANEETLVTAYFGYVYSTLRYGIIFWGNSTDISHVFKSQKKCIRAMKNLKSTDSCKQHFINLKILTVPCLYIYEIASFLKSNRHLFDSFRSLRCQNKVAAKSRKSALYNKSVLGMAPKIFNSLPRYIRDLESVTQFRSELKKILVGKAYYTLHEFFTDQSQKY